ncbi:tRNA dihydrouridine synthase DusB [Pseudofulvimonas gallinarii]|uniref:tRNA-dihydrouridine synthase B n=1 Tax=Pseudofulvimonas gallinarii TaxID=634155 RepID=A0A4S3KY82_9GAMM|nr:tRNA dihydrouridine synthase DusB [Pseudofulvimonas gallinarii]TCS93697.1 tRNA-U20-dihydrouridine synthase [Pseudofulvimonas gallinarii]THD14240.1 tRNA dihydrouridine synthase DusB [Pseudofulvimonas gallinarii]
MKIGPYDIEPALVLAPMAGITDKPFRVLCKRLGAGLCVSEMTASDPSVWQTRKSRLRRDHAGEPEPVSVQIAGYDPEMLADAARFNVDEGAQIIDINMGCPAKKVCKREAGSALLADEPLVARILDAVVRAVDVPVTLKIRTGPSPDRRNGETIARIAEDCGIAALAVHGRTRADRFLGQAEYDTIARIKSAVSIPVMANGDVATPEQARQVLAATGADAVMIGRAAQGRPWIFREIGHFLRTGERLPLPTRAEAGAILLGHLDDLYAFYGEHMGVRIARKHIGWYTQAHADAQSFWSAVSRVDTAAIQRRMVAEFFTLAGVAALAQAA